MFTIMCCLNCKNAKQSSIYTSISNYGPHSNSLCWLVLYEYICMSLSVFWDS